MRIISTNLRNLEIKINWESRAGWFMLGLTWEIATQSKIGHVDCWGRHGGWGDGPGLWNRVWAILCPVVYDGRGLSSLFMLNVLLLFRYWRWPGRVQTRVHRDTLFFSFLYIDMDGSAVIKKAYREPDDDHNDHNVVLYARGHWRHPLSLWMLFSLLALGAAFRSLYSNFILRLILRHPTLINLNIRKQLWTQRTVPQSRCPQKPQNLISIKLRSVRLSFYSLCYSLYFSSSTVSLQSRTLWGIVLRWRTCSPKFCKTLNTFQRLRKLSTVWVFCSLFYSTRRVSNHSTVEVELPTKGKRKAASSPEDGDASKKRKRPIKPKDPNAPKRPASSYILFQNEVRKELKERHPELSNTDLLSLISEQWKSMSDEQKEASRV